MSTGLFRHDIEDIYRYNYGCGVGIISKNGGSYDNSKKDAEQDKNIEENKSNIEKNAQSLEENEKRDDKQQEQLDANDALDVAQQKQIDENTKRLDENDANDERQQREIENNRIEIERISGEMPTLEVEGTTMIIGKKKVNQNK